MHIGGSHVQKYRDLFRWNGNTAIKGRAINVFKMFEAIDLNGHKTRLELCPQVALYDDGVGTEDFKPLKMFAGATGWGLSRNVKQLYKELVPHLRPRRSALSLRIQSRRFYCTDAGRSHRGLRHSEIPPIGNDGGAQCYGQ
jgi:hypothetical protein